MFLFRCGPVCDSCAVEDTREPTQEPFMEHTSVFANEAEVANDYCEEAADPPQRLANAEKKRRQQEQDEPEAEQRLQPQASQGNEGSAPDASHYWTQFGNLIGQATPRPKQGVPKQAAVDPPETGMYFCSTEETIFTARKPTNNNPASSKGSLASDTTKTSSDASRSTPSYAVGEHVHNRLAALEERFSLKKRS